MKTLYYKVGKPNKDHKYKEHQVYLNFDISPNLSFDLDIDGVFDKRSLNINILNLFELSINYETKCDHEGFMFSIGLLGLNYSFNYIDNRHWDFDKETYETH